jgi:hypothetical protein
MSTTYTVYNREHKEYFDLGKLQKTENKYRFQEESKLIDYIYYKTKFSSSINIEIISDYVDEFKSIDSYTELDDFLFPPSLTEDLTFMVRLPELKMDSIQLSINDLLPLIYKYINNSLLIELKLQQNHLT